MPTSGSHVPAIERDVGRDGAQRRVRGVLDGSEPEQLREEVDPVELGCGEEGQPRRTDDVRARAPVQQLLRQPEHGLGRRRLGIGADAEGPHGAGGGAERQCRPPGP